MLNELIASPTKKLPLEFVDNINKAIANICPA